VEEELLRRPAQARKKVPTVLLQFFLRLLQLVVEVLEE
jgi:hypothetical protein